MYVKILNSPIEVGKRKDSIFIVFRFCQKFRTKANKTGKTQVDTPLKTQNERSQYAQGKLPGKLPFEDRKTLFLDQEKSKSQISEISFRKKSVKNEYAQGELQFEKKLSSNWELDKRTVGPLERLQKSHKTKKGDPFVFLALSDVLKKNRLVKGHPKAFHEGKRQFSNHMGIPSGNFCH